MSGFVANGGAEAEEAQVTNNGFFPAIDPAHFREATRQDKTVTYDRLKLALIEAIAAANRELASWEAQQQDAGHNTLDAVPQAEVGGEGILLHHYRRAVYSLAKAELLERYRDFDATRSGAERDEENPAPDDVYRRDARWALAAIRGTERVVVELI